MVEFVVERSGEGDDDGRRRVLVADVVLDDEARTGAALFGSPATDGARAPDGGGSGIEVETLDTTVAVVSLVVTIVGGLFGGGYLHGRRGRNGESRATRVARGYRVPTGEFAGGPPELFCGRQSTLPTRRWTIRIRHAWTTTRSPN